MIYRTTLRSVTGAVHVNFKVTPQMLPNAALQAVVVRRAGAAKTLALTGMTGFNVDLDRALPEPRHSSAQRDGNARKRPTR